VKRQYFFSYYSKTKSSSGILDGVKENGFSSSETSPNAPVIPKSLQVEVADDADGPNRKSLITSNWYGCVLQIPMIMNFFNSE